MLNFPALDVAIGIVFVYFILALVCSGVNEAISSWARWRAQDLERGLWELLEDPEQGSAALEKLKAHPLIRPMMNPKTKGRAGTAAATARTSFHLKTNRKTDFPSYLPSRTAITALLGLEQDAVQVAKNQDVRDALRKIDKSIQAIPSEPARRALTALLHSAQGDSVAFRRSAEQWFDDHMERVSGWYRRRIQRVLWILAFVIVFALNADTLQMAKRLWVEPSVRAALVSQAGGASKTTDPSTELKSLSVPLGWHLATARRDPQGFPFYQQPSMVWSLLSKLLGLMLTVVAVTFGAPFWFDLLSKLGRLRNSGAPPTATDATRVGEGEETRRGDSTSLATAMLEVMGKSGEESDANVSGKSGEESDAAVSAKTKAEPEGTPPADVQ
jgi:hypothetical protein